MPKIFILTVTRRPRRNSDAWDLNGFVLLPNKQLLPIPIISNISRTMTPIFETIKTAEPPPSSVAALTLDLDQSVRHCPISSRNDHLSFLEPENNMNELSASSGAGNPGKMALVDKVERIISDRYLMVDTADVSFFTTVACRLFKSNYYYFSLKLLHSKADPGRLQGLLDAQSKFTNGLQALRTEDSMKAYPAWAAIGNALREIRLVDVRHVTRECRNLAKTFRTLDEFMIPVYVAQTHKMISSAESKMIAEKVKTLYDTMVRRFSE